MLERSQFVILDFFWRYQIYLNEFRLFLEDFGLVVEILDVYYRKEMYLGCILDLFKVIQIQFQVLG